jgi:hypothetical protein
MKFLSFWKLVMNGGPGRRTDLKSEREERKLSNK